MRILIAIALLTGIRLAGGVILMAGGLWCVFQLLRLAGAWRTAVVGLVYVGDPCRVRDRRGGLSDCAEGGFEELSDSSPRRT